MSLTKLLGDDLEKPPIESTEPIIFRPMTEPSKFGTPTSFLRRSANQTVDNEQLRYRRCRLLKMFGVILFVSMIPICVFISTMFLLRLGPFSSQHSHESGTYGKVTYSYHLILPFNSINQGGELTEEIILPMTGAQKMMPFPGDILNVSLKPFPPFPYEQILHLFTDRLTVIRTLRRCYIRPMRKEMLQAYMHGYINKLKQNQKGIEMQALPKGELISEQFYATKAPGTIENSLVMHWCNGLPAFQLVTRRPPNISTRDWFPSVPSSSTHDLEIMVDDDQQADYFQDSGHGQVSDSKLDEAAEGSGDDFGFLFSRRSPRTRHRRHVPLSAAMRVRPDQLPKVYQESDDRPTCPVVDEVLEDFIVTPTSEESAASSTVKVTRDVIMEC